MKLQDKIAILACNKIKYKDQEQIKAMVNERYSSGRPMVVRTAIREMSTKKEVYDKLTKHRYVKTTESYFIAISEDYINRTEISAIIETCNSESKNIDKNTFIT